MMGSNEKVMKNDGAFLSTNMVISISRGAQYVTLYTLNWMTKRETMFWLCIITHSSLAVAGNWRTSGFAPAQKTIIK
jgi:hypothetical protein